MKNTHYFFLLGFILFGFKSTHGQPELRYATDAEKTVLNAALGEQEFNSLALLVGTDAKLTDEISARCASEYGDLIAELEQSDVKSQGEKKAVKLIQKSVQAHQKRYVRQAEFTHLFTKGEYSATTGTALYALVFDHFELPYALRENEKSTYLVAFPKGAAVPLSSLPPNAGYLVETTSSRQNFIGYLKAHKAVPVKELVGDPKAVFNKHYYPHIQNDVTKVAARLYYEQGNLIMEEQKVERASIYYSKAYALHPSERHWYWYSNTLVVQLGNASISDSTTHKRIAELANLSVNNEPFLEAARAFNALILEMPAHAYEVDKAWTTINKNLTHEAARKEFAGLYFYEKSRLAALDRRYREALKAIESAYAVQSESEDVQRQFRGVLLLDQKSGNVISAVEKLEEYCERYPFLQEDSEFNKTFGNWCLAAAIEHLREKRLEDGLKALNRFEALSQKYTKLMVRPDLLTNGYMGAGLLLMDNKRKGDAVALVIRGLEASPDNEVLKELLVEFEK